MSLSVKNRECAWYAEERCDLDNLWPAPADANDYTTVRVRSPGRLVADVRAVAPPPNREQAVDSPIRLAIFGVAVGFGCGLVRWCEDARQLLAALPQTRFDGQIVVLTEDSASADGADPRDCPGAKFVRADWDLEAAAASCVARLYDQQGSQSRPLWRGKASERRVHYKWQAFALTEFDIVLVLDIDVLLWAGPPDANKVRNRWLAMAPQLLDAAARQGSVVLGHPHYAPINTGHMVLVPWQDLFRHGVKALRHCKFEPTRGWELVGPPRSLPLAFGRHLDGRPATDLGQDGLASTLRPDWNFIGGNIDQGFFWYMLAVRSDFLRYFRSHANAHHAMPHFCHNVKPWEPEMATSAFNCSDPRCRTNRAFWKLHMCAARCCRHHRDSTYHGQC